jgi:hypothetical protein
MAVAECNGPKHAARRGSGASYPSTATEALCRQPPAKKSISVKKLIRTARRSLTAGPLASRPIFETKAAGLLKLCILFTAATAMSASAQTVVVAVSATASNDNVRRTTCPTASASPTPQSSRTVTQSLRSGRSFKRFPSRAPTDSRKVTTPGGRLAR